MASDGAQFCTNCGYNFQTADQQAPETIPYAPYSSTTEPTAVYTTGSASAAAYQPQPRNIYRILSVVLGVLLLGVSVVLIIVLSRVSGKSAVKSGMTPRQTIESVYKAGTDLYEKLAADNLTEGDLLVAYSTMMDLIPNEAKKQMIRMMKYEVERSGGLPKLEVVSEDISPSGDSATVVVRVTTMRGPDLQPRTETSPPIPMIKEDGKWKLDVMRGMRPLRF